MRFLVRIQRLISDWYLSLGLVIVTLMMAWVLWVNSSQTNRINEVLKHEQSNTELNRARDCAGRAEGREALRDFITLVRDAPIVTPERRVLYDDLLGRLPAIDCKAELAKDTQTKNDPIPTSTTTRSTTP